MSTQNEFLDAGRADLGDKLPDILKYQRARQRGCVPSARMAATVQPTALDTVTIGGVSFRIVAALAAAASYVQVLRGGSASITYTALYNAINGDAATKDVTWVEATTAFAEKVKADMASGGTKLRLQLAKTRGGVVVPGISPSITLAASISGGAAAWSVANLNATGKALSDQDYSEFTVVVTAAMITDGHIYVEVPFAVGSQGNVVWRVQGAGNDTKETNDTASWTTSGDTTSIDFVFSVGYTALTGIAAGDRVTFRVNK